METYEVMDVDLLDEWQYADTISGVDHEHAATEWMEANWTCDDYPDRVDLVVRRKGTGDVRRIVATAEQTVEFCAREVAPPNETRRDKEE